jgi:hypothetical protein
MRRSRGGSIEEDLLALLHSAGLPDPDDRPPSEDELARAESVAAAALRHIVTTPRDPIPHDERANNADADPADTTAGAAAARASGRGVLSSRAGTRTYRPSKRPVARWVLASFWVSTVVAATVLVVTQVDTSVNQPRRSPQAAETSLGAGDGSPSPPRATSVPGSDAEGTPALTDFALASYSGDGVAGRPAERALRAIARTAATQSPSAALPVQHIVLDSWFLVPEPGSPGETSLVPTLTDRYYLPDGSMRSLEYVGDPLDNAGRSTALPPRTPDRLRADETFPGPAEGPRFAEELPTSAGALVSDLVPDARECPVVAQCLVSRIQDICYTWTTRPALVSALWRALGTQPGVEYLGLARDRFDRPAEGFAVKAFDSSTETILYADPTTGSLLGSETLLLNSSSSGNVADGSEESSLPTVHSFTMLASSQRIALEEVPARGDHRTGRP